MAFDASKPDEAGPIGVFGVPSDGQQLDCPGGTQVCISSVLCRNKQIKSPI